MQRKDIGFYVLALVTTVAVLSIVINVFDWQVNSVYGVASSTVTVSSTVIVGNAAPTVSGVTINGGNAITLTPNATTAVSVYATITDNNGCGDINPAGTSSIYIYRSGYTSSSCLTTQNDQYCYLATAFTATSTCSNGIMNATTTFGVYYFADATDASNTEFTSQNWLAFVIFRDANNSTGSAESLAGVDVNSMTAINVTTSSINYGTLAANSTSTSDSITTSTNAGNTSTTLNISANATLTSGNNSISTSSQHYATATFLYGGLEQTLDPTPKFVAGSIMTKPTSTANVNRPIFWRLSVPGGTATGTYTGVNLFTAVYVTSTPL